MAATTNTKKFVRIQSSVTINVTAGLQLQDVTDEKAQIPDRLKVQPEWHKLTVLIREGSHLYPAQVASWRTVKALEKEGILTVGAFTDSADETTAAKEKELKVNLEEVKKRASNFKLEDIAEGE